MKPTNLKPQDVETIFAASRVNGAIYLGEHLTEQPWQWPRGTFLQRRLDELRKERGDERQD